MVALGERQRGKEQALNRRKSFFKKCSFLCFSEMLKVKSKMSKKYDKMLIVEVFLRTYNVTE